MLTTCPQCALNLALTVADLRSGQGYVRCGRCSNVFNALPTLRDEGEAEDQASATATRPALDLDSMRAKSGVAASSKAGKRSIGLDADDDEITGEHEMERTGTFETIVLEGDAIMQTEETVPESEVDAQLQALVQRFDAVREPPVEVGTPAAADVPGPTGSAALDEGGLDLENAEQPLDLAGEPILDIDEADEDEVAVLPVVPESPPEAPPERLPGAAAAATEAGTEPVEATDIAPVSSIATEEPFGPPPPVGGTPPRFRQGTLWLAATIALALLLAGATVHHYRESLATLPWASGALTRIYGLFQVSLEPRWDLSAYEVRQLGADAAIGSEPKIIVRARVHNRASRPQPPPFLRVVLQDRFGNQISSRDVAPNEYLHGGVPARLGADQRIDAALTLPDPGQNAVGFEIDACLRGVNGKLRCASDAPTR